MQRVFRSALVGDFSLSGRTACGERMAAANRVNSSGTVATNSATVSYTPGAVAWRSVTPTLVEAETASMKLDVTRSSKDIWKPKVEAISKPEASAIKFAARHARSIGLRPSARQAFAATDSCTTREG